MADYNFWADLLDTFQSSADWIKALWLLIPPGFMLALIAMLMRYRIARMRMETVPDEGPVYFVHPGQDGDMQVVGHLPEVGRRPALLLSNKLSHDTEAWQSFDTRP